METFEVISAKWLQKYQKAVGFPLKLDAVLRLCKRSKTVSKTVFWSIQKSWPEYLIKPIEFWWFPSPNRKKAPKWSKSIRFIDKTHMAFRHVGKPYKTCRKWRFLRGQKCKNLTSWPNPGGARIPPPFVWMAAEPENVQKWASHIERGGGINNLSDWYFWSPFCKIGP